MAKLIHITDIKPMEIFIGRKTRGPITMRMEDNVIGRLIHSMDPPKGIYAVSKDGKEVRLNETNYKLTEDQLFGIVPVEKPVEPKPVDDVKARDESLKKSLEALKLKQQKQTDDTKSDEVEKSDSKIETAETDVVEESKNDSEDTKVDVQESITESDIAEKLDTPKDEDDKETLVSYNKTNDKPANLNYNSKNYNKNNKKK